MYLAMQPERAKLSDVNEELIETLEVIATAADDVVSAVWRYSNTAECFYRVRASVPRTEVGRAARFLYLNRTAWGGIYRLNRFGQFNAPFGNSGRVICRRSSVVEAAAVFERAELESTEFEVAFARAEIGDVVYADPPYAGPSSGHESFMRYTPGRFRWLDQVRLAEVAKDAADRGVVVAVSGRADFDVESLYPGWIAMHLPRNCRVSRSVNARATFNEVVLISPNADVEESVQVGL
jgi:DNA adenine methylase